MSSKLKIKLGQLEVEYEGSEEFLKEELPILLKSFADLAASRKIPIFQEVQDGAGGGSVGSRHGKQKLALAPNSIAAKLNSQSGSDLLFAAAAFLAFAEQRDSFTRDELHDAMKPATSYYKSSFGNNLSKYIETLVKTHKLLQRPGGSYALHADAEKEVESRLDN